MKKILSLVVLVATFAMVGCLCNNNKKSATCEKVTCEQCVEAANAVEQPAECCAESCCEKKAECKSECCKDKAECKGDCKKEECKKEECKKEECKSDCKKEECKKECCQK